MADAGVLGGRPHSGWAWVLAGCLWACSDSASRPQPLPPSGGARRPTAPAEPKAPGGKARHEPRGTLSRAALREDLRQLKRLLEESHPDPYTNGGGTIAFNRRFRAIWDGIPAKGLGRRAFLRRVRPLVASVRDGHTKIGLGGRRHKKVRWGVDLDICDRKLLVRRVYRPEHRDLLGSELIAIEGIAYPELVRRMKRLRGYDNEVNNLVHLADALDRPAPLADLLERVQLPTKLRFRFRTPVGKRREVLLSSRRSPSGTALEPPSRVAIPQANAAGIGWGFLGKEGKVAYLRVDSMVRYREAFEAWSSSGQVPRLEKLLDRVLGKQTGNAPLKTRIRAVPAATDSFRALARAMRRRSTEALIVDVRRNRGGNSLLLLILTYFLYGLDALDDVEGYQIPRYSELYFRQFTKIDRRKKLGDLSIGDYDFSQEKAWRQRKRTGPTAAFRRESRAATRRLVAMMPTFAEEIRAHRWTPLRPAWVLVVTSAFTYSAGYDLAAGLYKLGAKIVGVPSGQAGNCFIDALFFRLKHSRLQGTISFKRSLDFPDKPRLGKLLEPKVLLTCRRLRKLGFDPNAGVLLALDYLKRAPGKSR